MLPPENKTDERNLERLKPSLLGKNLVETEAGRKNELLLHVPYTKVKILNKQDSKSNKTPKYRESLTH